MSPRNRRSFLKLSGLVLLGLGGIGLFSAVKILPRPPRKVLVKEKLKEGQILVRPEFFLRLTEEGPLALSRRCPHLGCPVTYAPDKEEFVCPCHQSRFSLEGRYLAGPAKKDLARLPVKKTEGGLIVELPA